MELFVSQCWSMHMPVLAQIDRIVCTLYVPALAQIENVLLYMLYVPVLA